MAGCWAWICPAAAGLAAGADMLPLLGLRPSIRDRKLPEASSLPALPSEPACGGSTQARVGAHCMDWRVLLCLQQAADLLRSCYVQLMQVILGVGLMCKRGLSKVVFTKESLPLVGLGYATVQESLPQSTAVKSAAFCLS
jgi:hypothetical protein